MGKASNSKKERREAREGQAAAAAQMAAMWPTTPPSIDAQVVAFANSLSQGSVPQYLPFTPRDHAYLPGNCLNNCEAERLKSPGSAMVQGWMIWVNVMGGGRHFDAEFHAVVMEGGCLVDVTPRRDGEAKILFVPDAMRKAKKAGPLWRTWTNQTAKWENGSLVTTAAAQPTERPV